MDMSKIPQEDKDEILSILLKKLVYVDQYMGHGHWKIEMRGEELVPVVEILDRTFQKES